MGKDTILKFKALWTEFDPKGKGFISVENFPKLIYMLIYEEIKDRYLVRE